ncbi:MAG: HAD family hydrolase [Candidatus Hodarchaeales archaeon]|jgi:HAD superfamily hydrolase (TIGR01549 family)
MINPPAILFDMDGTLVDSDKIVILSLKKARDSLCPTIPWDVNKLRSLMGQPGMKVIEGLGVPINIRESYFQVFLSHFNKHYKNQTKLFPSVEQNLQLLKKLGIKLGVITGAGSTSAIEILSLFNISDYFDVIVGGDSTKRGKPSAEPVLHALKALDVLKYKNKVPFIGDNINDMRAARAAGIISVLFCSDGKKVPTNWKKLADHVLHDFNGLRSLIDNL